MFLTLERDQMQRLRFASRFQARVFNGIHQMFRHVSLHPQGRGTQQAIIREKHRSARQMAGIHAPFPAQGSHDHMQERLDIIFLDRFTNQGIQFRIIRRQPFGHALHRAAVGQRLVNELS